MADPAVVDQQHQTFSPSPRRLLSRSEAASYCALSVPKFLGVCSIRPVHLGPGKRMERYDKRDLDRWIDLLKGADARSEFDKLLDGLNDEETANSRP